MASPISSSPPIVFNGENEPPRKRHRLSRSDISPLVLPGFISQSCKDDEDDTHIPAIRRYSEGSRRLYHSGHLFDDNIEIKILNLVRRLIADGRDHAVKEIWRSAKEIADADATNDVRIVESPR